MADILMVDAPPVGGTNEVQQLTASAALTAGQFRLHYRNNRTAALNYNATAVQIRDALRALNEVQADGIATATGGPVNAVATPVVLTFGGHLAVADVQLLTVENIGLVGGTINVTTTTPGVTATLRGAGKGTVVVSTSNGKMYINEGTDIAPVWRMVTAT